MLGLDDFCKVRSLRVTARFVRRERTYRFRVFLPSSTAQGGGGSFKDRKPTGEVGCCESRMEERIHRWTERWLELCFLEWFYVYSAHVFQVPWKNQRDCVQGDPFAGNMYSDPLLSTLIHSYPTLIHAYPLLSHSYPLLSLIPLVSPHSCSTPIHSYQLLSNSYSICY